MLTELAPQELARADIGFDDLFPEQVDPLAKNCPEDLPCRVSDSDLWFAETPAELEQAKALCDGCPARIACLTGAIERREPWGVWGGEIFERGAIVARKRPRGRPRKHPVVEPAAAVSAGRAVAARPADTLDSDHTANRANDCANDEAAA